MELLYISNFQFTVKSDGFYTLPAYSNHFWAKYLEAFDSITVLGVEMYPYLKNDSLVKISDDRINIVIIKNNVHFMDFINDSDISRTLESYIKSYTTILIKPSSRKGIKAIQIAKKHNKEVLIELTGDLHHSLQNSHSFLRRLYAPLIYFQIKRAIKDIKYGLYVTQEYLQKKYPIRGLQCGCTDTIIPNPNTIRLSNRLNKIDRMSREDDFHIGLIGFYHGRGKGIDTAIKALSLLPSNYVLNILGYGVEKDRLYWFNYAKNMILEDRLYFSEPRNSVENVLNWIEKMDLIILPSRSEGLPRSIVEAISVGCPCVVSDVCGLPELVESKWTHKPNDFRKLAQLIHLISSNKETLINTSRINFKKSFEFSSSKLSEKRNIFLNKYINAAVKNEKKIK